jgi:glycosyltransferase involved in cell wall biosynthesis
VQLRIGVSVTPLESGGGVEMSTLQVTRALAERGHEIHVFYEEDGPLRPAFEDYGAILQQVDTLNLDMRHPVRGARSTLPAARAWRAAGGDVLWLNRFEHILWAQGLSRWAGSAVVCHLRHGPNYRRTHLLAHGVTEFLAVSSYIRDRWIAAGLEPERVRVVHNAVPQEDYPRGGLAERAAARAALGLPPDVFVALCYGRRDREKGVDMLLDAWQRADLPEGSCLVVAGGPTGPDGGATPTEFSEGADASVVWLPTQLDVRPLLHASDLVVLPSRWDEPFGRVVVEGLLSGRPVVATRVGGIPEILTGPFEHLLVDRDDAVALAGRLEELATWRTDRPELAQECAAFAEEHFAFDSLVDAVEESLVRATLRRRHRT